MTTKRWQELEPRRVYAEEACVGRDETELSLEPGDIVTEVRPADFRWLEGTLEGRVVLLPECCVDYLPALSVSDGRNK